MNARSEFFLPPASIEILCRYKSAVDVGIMNNENICIRYYYTLPKKIFENIHSETHEKRTLFGK